MKLTSQEEYGLRCIVTLARQAIRLPRTPSLTLAQIAERECLSTEYTGKLMGILSRAGLVESVRGRNGGYRLARRAEEISVADTLAALGGKFYHRHETCDRFPGDQNLCVHSSACSIRSLWSGLQVLIDHVLTRTTLEDLATAEEGNVASWMHSHLEAVTDLQPLASTVGGSPVSSGSNVVVRRNPERG